MVVVAGSAGLSTAELPALVVSDTGTDVDAGEEAEGDSVVPRTIVVVLGSSVVVEFVVLETGLGSAAVG